MWHAPQIDLEAILSRAFRTKPQGAFPPNRCQQIIDNNELQMDYANAWPFDMRYCVQLN